MVKVNTGIKQTSLANLNTSISRAGKFKMGQQKVANTTYTAQNTKMDLVYSIIALTGRLHLILSIFFHTKAFLTTCLTKGCLMAVLELRCL